MGLLKTAATVAVASAVHGRVQRRQQAKWAGQDQANAAAMQAPPPYAPVASAPAPNMSEQLAQLAQLGELLNAGILSETEFQQQRARILNG